MRTRVLQVVVVSLLAVLLTSGVAMAGRPAPVVYATLDQVNALIATAVDGLQTQIDALSARLGTTEADVTSLDGRVDAVEAATGGGTQFPDLQVTVTPNVAAMFYSTSGERRIAVWLSFEQKMADGSTINYAAPLDTFMDVTINDTYHMNGSTWELNAEWDCTNPPNFPVYFGHASGYPVPNGAPIRIEYVVRTPYGQTFHGVETVTNWQWTYWN